MDVDKQLAESIRKDMIFNLTGIINAATNLKAELEESQEIGDFSETASTFGVAYGSMGGSIMALIQNEAKYNILIQQIVRKRFTEDC